MNQRIGFFCGGGDIQFLFWISHFNNKWKMLCLKNKSKLAMCILFQSNKDILRPELL